MPYHTLESYLSRLSRGNGDDTKLWIDSEGRVQGRFFNCALTSQFQPILNLEGKIQGFDAHAHSYSKEDRGLSVWKMLNGAASDSESIELDRLCRILHVLNFFRQAQDVHGSLLISVHERLLAAITTNHGAVFRRILDGLELPNERIVLQLPQSSQERQWMIGFVVANYRRNGFRIATRASGADEALHQLEHLRPDLIRIDAHSVGSISRLAEVIEYADALGSRLVFSRVDRESDLYSVAEALELSGIPLTDSLWITGGLAGLPEASLHSSENANATTVGQVVLQARPAAYYT